MKTLTFAHSGRAIEVKTDSRILEALLAEQVPVKRACGGRGLCATCHVYVERGAQSLTPRTSREERTLGFVAGMDSSSRLACQARIVADGVVVRLPSGLYVENVVDWNDLVGRRAEVPLLHPVNGKVLVQAGKLVTKTMLQSLSAAQADLAAIVSVTEEA